MQLQIESDESGNLVAKQSGGTWARLLIGVPVLAVGLVALLGAIGQELIAVLALLLFAVCFLPLGWWILFGRCWIAIEPNAGEIVEITDWKIGRKSKRTPLKSFHAVRVALEPLTNNRRSVVRVQKIRLLSRGSSIEIGWLDKENRQQAIELGQRVAGATGLPFKEGKAE